MVSALWRHRVPFDTVLGYSALFSCQKEEGSPMDAQVQTIVNDLPELGERLRRLEYDERSECAVLDHRESTHLLSVGKGSHRHRTTNYVYANGSSAIAVVDRDQEHYRLRYFEQYNYDTLMGLSTLPHAPQSSYACVKKTTPSVFEWAMTMST